MLSRMEADEKSSFPPQPEPGTEELVLPQRASIYIDVNGTVHFGALFEGLVPVARALGAPEAPPRSAAGPPVPSAPEPDPGPGDPG